MHLTTPREVLEKYWGYPSFRPLQEEAIEAVLSGRDALVLLATGGGKSLCYQVPAIMLEGLTLVVSPLIALMKDQVERLKRQGVKAEALHSGLERRELEQILERALDGQLKLLYLSPERLATERFLQRVRYLNIALVAVDEAHCISQWGYDFRPSYLNIAALRQHLPGVPFMALTATATKRVMVDIREKLEFEAGAVTIKSPYYRSNLSLNVFEEENKLGKLLNICTKLAGTGIVYVRNRRQTLLIAEYLTRRGVTAAAYHAGMDASLRQVTQEEWLADKYRVIVATNAFGMGIDKADVRFVVHMDMPDALEAYYQEVGRAGRDGKPGYAVLLYNTSDFEMLDHQYEIAYPPVDYIRRVYDKLGRYLNIAIGARQEEPVPFELDAFAVWLKEDSAKIGSVLRLLRQEELVAFTEGIYQPATLQIKVSGREILQIRKDRPSFDALLSTLLRRYEGLYTVRTRISLSNLAKVLKLDEAEIERRLKQLHELGVVDYRRAGVRPEIIWLQPRVEQHLLAIDKKRYKFRAGVAAENVKKMKRYVGLDTCRYAYILRHFGEEGKTKCGTCDVCMGSKSAYLPREMEGQYRARILKMLQGKWLHPFDIVNAFPYNRKRAVIRLLETMEEEGALSCREMKYTAAYES